MTLTLWTADGIHLAAVAEDIVVLDVRADRYDGLLDAAAWLKVEGGGRLSVRDASAAEALQAAGLARAEPPARPRRDPRPARTVVARDGPVPLTAGLSAALDLMRASRGFSGQAFEALLASDAPSFPATEGEDSAIQAHMRALGAALPWVPGEGQCLKRAFMLRRALARRGLETDWVFGVRTWPFAAHCWLQVGDAVLGDSLERVRRYTPILVA